MERGGGVSFLLAYIDPAMEVPATETQEHINKVETERVVSMLTIAITAQDMPRRLGTEATPEELAADKSRNKRVAHVATQLLKGWQPGMNGNKPTENVRREAASVDWKKWLIEHETFLINRCRYVATWQHKYGDDLSLHWAKAAVTRLENEGKWLKYAVREG